LERNIKKNDVIMEKIEYMNSGVKRTEKRELDVNEKVS
jgi:hypothetical protein